MQCNVVRRFAGVKPRLYQGHTVEKSFCEAIGPSHECKTVKRRHAAVLSDLNAKGDYLKVLFFTPNASGPSDDGDDDNNSAMLSASGFVCHSSTLHVLINQLSTQQQRIILIFILFRFDPKKTNSKRFGFL